MSNISYYTPEGFSKLKEELDYLIIKGRKSIAKQIAEARAKGDLSENAEYDAAKHAQGLLELKITKLEKIMQHARVLAKDQVDTTQVSLFTTVTIKNKQQGRTLSYTIVSTAEADLRKGKISIQSPIAQGILGKSIGEMATIQTPAGSMDVEIIAID